MADLYAIYQEQGLGGLIPHALKDTSHGYRILLDKIKAGNPLYFIRTQMETPHIVVKDGHYQTLFYTSATLADRQAQDLKAAGYNPEVEDLPDGAARKEALLWLFDHGPTSILLDDSLSIPISALVPEVPDYDGRPNEEHMLRNRALNGATFYFLQQAAAGYGNMEAERQWAKAMYNGELIAAVENSVERNYPSLSVKVKDKDALLVYSDWRQVGFDFETLPAGVIVNYNNLRQILEENPNVVLLLNQSTCHLVIDLPLMDAIKGLATNAKTPSNPIPGLDSGVKKKGFTFGQIPEDEWETTDPTPDFLK